MILWWIGSTDLHELGYAYTGLRTSYNQARVILLSVPSGKHLRTHPQRQKVLRQSLSRFLECSVHQSVCYL